MRPGSRDSAPCRPRLTCNARVCVRADDDFVTFVEFRLLLTYLKLYFGLFTVFDAIDTGDDRRVDVDEFTAAADDLKELGVPIGKNPAATFAKVRASERGPACRMHARD